MGHTPAAALHPQRPGGPGALPDGLRPPARQRRRTHRRAALHAGTADPHPGRRSGDRLRHAARGAGHLSSGAGRRSDDAPHPHRALLAGRQITADALNRARAEGRRIIAVGTTSVRVLEQAAADAASEGRTDFEPIGRRTPASTSSPATGSGPWTPCSPTSTCPAPRC